MWLMAAPVLLVALRINRSTLIHFTKTLPCFSRKQLSNIQNETQTHAMEQVNFVVEKGSS
jgi:hypothetical protein